MEPTLQHITVFIINLPRCEITRFRADRESAPEFDIPHGAQCPVRGMARQIACSEYVQPGEVGEIAQLDGDGLGIGRDVRNLHRLQYRKLKMAQLAKDITRLDRTGSDSQLNTFLRFFEPKLVIACIQAGDLDHPVLDGEAIEAIRVYGIATHFK